MAEGSKVQKNPVLDNIVHSAKAAAEQVETPAQPSLQAYEHLIVDENLDVPEPVPIISIAGETISTPGNLTTLSGQAKSGKSAFTQPLIAGAISSTCIDQLDGVEIVPSTGKAVILFDTEQSKPKHKKSHEAILKRAGLSSSPEYFKSYNFLELSKSIDRQQALVNICELANEKFGGIHLLVIDGIADFIDDPQDAKESTAIVNLVHSIATKYLCTVILIIHLNPSPAGQPAKERGHLGSHLQRKSESTLQITSNGDVSTLEPKLLRMAGKGKIPLIQFSYDPGRGYHVFVGHKETDKKSVDSTKYRQWAKAVMPNNLLVSYGNLVEKLEAETMKGTDSVKKYIRTMTELGIIKKEGKDGYRIVN
jgi:hypothetical protein